MNAEAGDQDPKSNNKGGSDNKSSPPPGSGTEAERKGGVEPAKRQAERDWEDSAKESGD